VLSGALCNNLQLALPQSLEFVFDMPIPIQKHVLIVEDDEVVAKLLEAHLTNAGYGVTTRPDGVDLLAVVRALAPDAIILDGSLPSADGFELCRDLRPNYRGIIILLTARDEVIDELLGLELGADDYIRKPANSRVVLAHLRACLRRADSSATTSNETLSIGKLSISPQSRKVLLGKKELSLTTAEFDLLWALASRAGTVVSRDDLLLISI
jgi:DNA-binding response OmpR family regulator